MKLDVVRAWKDESYRQSLSEEQIGQMPANPAGEIELTEMELLSIYGDGGAGPYGAPVAAIHHAVAPVGLGAVGVAAAAPVPVLVPGWFNNFNRIVLSTRCSIDCSFGCDIIERRRLDNDF